ncbi:MAG: FAD-binding oxidoreductase [Phycisphaerales bacterium]|nr:FAD-binding oxidoreductase [Phycisphaerales bacterium]
MHADDARADSPRSPIDRRDALRRLAAGAALPAVGAMLEGCAIEKPHSIEYPILRRQAAPRLTLRGDPGYEQQRAALLFNRRTPGRYPDLIVHAESAADVQAAVRQARASGMKVSIRSGGHTWCGPALRDGGILIDLGPMRTHVISAASRTARVGPAMTGGEFIAALEPHGLAFPVGHCPTVPMGGFLLNGGFGWNAGAWGPACLSVRGLEIVNASGELVYASENDNTDLFWAARGAGPGFFGAVTRFDVALHPLPRAIHSSTFFFRPGDARAVGEWLSELVPSLPPTVETVAYFRAPPSSMSRSDGRAGERVLAVSAAAFADSQAQADAWLEPFIKGPPGVRADRRQDEKETFRSLHDGMARLYPQPRRYGVDAIWTAAAPGELLEQMAARAELAPTPESFILIALLPPPPPGPGPDIALSMFAPAFTAVYGVWADADLDAKGDAWVRGTAEQLREKTVGHYTGEADLYADPARGRRSFAEANWKRLSELKARHDPEGIFSGFPGAS